MINELPRGGLRKMMAVPQQLKDTEENREVFEKTKTKMKLKATHCAEIIRPISNCPEREKSILESLHLLMQFE